MRIFWAIVVIVAAGFYVSDRYAERSPVIEADGSRGPVIVKSDGVRRPVVASTDDSSTARGVAALPASASSPPASFQCDDRTRCPQMHSCEEARYFLANCPGTQMDGDHDGVPCEDQWCR